MECSAHKVTNTVIKRLIPCRKEISLLAEQVIKLRKEKLHLMITETMPRPCL
jgi:hypothetical protein